MVFAGHEKSEIEKTVETHRDYLVVEKQAEAGTIAENDQPSVCERELGLASTSSRSIPQSTSIMTATLSAPPVLEDVGSTGAGTGRITSAWSLGAAIVLAAALSGAPSAAGSQLQTYLRLPAPSLPPLPAGQLREGARDFGSSVAISRDGSIAVIGAPGSGAWAYVRSGTSWTLQQRLATVGGHVALSADGTTALVGVPCENKAGYVLVYVRSATGWIQQGQPLTPVDAQGSECEAAFGSAVALSGDGNTALIGGASDATHRGAAWIYARSSSGWAQQGPKLHATGESGPGSFGDSVALSADGNTALIGAPQDGSPPRTQSPDRHLGAGGAWIFTRSGSTWSQHQRLAPSDEALSAEGRGLFGSAVSLSGDGSTALIGGEADNGQGAAWIFARAGVGWAQQGPKLIGEHQRSGFGGGLALSADGNTALISQVPSGYSEGEYQQGWSRGGAGTLWPSARVAGTWVRGAATKGLNPQGANEEFGLGFAMSADASWAVVGAPDGFDDPGAAWAATLSPLPANSFSLGRIWIRPNGTLEQQIASSAAGTFSATATISPRALPPPTPRERRELRRCRARHRHKRRCPRSGPVLYGASTLAATAPGVETVAVLPGAAVHRALMSYEELTVTLTVAFQPGSGAPPAPQWRTIVMELGRRESY